jgi:hypothetical protein
METVMYHKLTNLALWHWVTAQHHRKNNFLMNEEREGKLDAIGFVWKVRECYAD